MSHQFHLESNSDFEWKPKSNKMHLLWSAQVASDVRKYQDCEHVVFETFSDTDVPEGVGDSNLVSPVDQIHMFRNRNTNIEKMYFIMSKSCHH